MSEDTIGIKPVDQIPHFDPADINPIIPNEAQIEIAQLVLAWAKLDAQVSHLLFEIFRMPYDLGQILIRRMSIVDKQARIVEIYAHFGNEIAQKAAQGSKKIIEKWYPIRNVVCHSECLGISISAHPGCLAFVTSNIIRGTPGTKKVVYYPIETIKDATGFAQHAAVGMTTLIDATGAIHAEWLQKVHG